MAGYRDMVLNARTTMMIGGSLEEEKDSFLGQMRHIADVRVVRGTALTGIQGNGVNTGDAVERDLLRDGTERVVLEDGVIRGVFPYVARRDVMGKNWVSCHSVAEGTVLGATSIRIPLEGTFVRIHSLQYRFVLFGLLGVARCPLGALTQRMGKMAGRKLSLGPSR